MEDLAGQVAPPRRVLITGMGASFHAAMWASHLLQARGIWAIAVEASDLLHFSWRLFDGNDCVVVISQSGASAEIRPLLGIIPSGMPVIGVTNQPEGPLGSASAVVLPIEAGGEVTVASKTYLNTLACLWLLVEAWAPADTTDASVLWRVADAVGEIVDTRQAVGATWLERLSHIERLYFVGHGPHVATARQGAMMMGEWVKRPAIAAGIGAFRHGLIEVADERCAVVMLGAGGATARSTADLAAELAAYGTTVLAVSEGQIVRSDLPPERHFSELLSPLLDVVPMQVFAETLARSLGLQPEFRRIAKVVRNI
jgi:glucosamine--fructose-6-phosphate aminotransferase (isomerizing)